MVPAPQDGPVLLGQTELSVSEFALELLERGKLIGGHSHPLGRDPYEPVRTVAQVVLVTDNLIDRLFKPERLAMILSSLAARRSEKARSLNTRLIALQKEVTDADEKLSRLYRLIEDGLTDLDDVLKDRLATLKAARDRAKAALERAKEGSASPIRVNPAAIERFGRLMSET